MLWLWSYFRIPFLEAVGMFEDMVYCLSKFKWFCYFELCMEQNAWQRSLWKGLQPHKDHVMWCFFSLPLKKPARCSLSSSIHIKWWQNPSLGCSIYNNPHGVTRSWDNYLFAVLKGRLQFWRFESNRLTMWFCHFRVVLLYSYPMGWDNLRIFGELYWGLCMLLWRSGDHVQLVAGRLTQGQRSCEDSHL